jgi:outer membrane protein assembly factor BamB
MQRDRTATDCVFATGNRPTLALIVFCVGLAAAATAAAQMLPSPRKSRIPPGQHLTGLDPRWSVTFDAAPAAPAGFDHERAYIALKDGSVKAIDLETGTERWKVELATTFAPETGDGFVFVAAGEEILALIDRSGEVGWKANAGGPIAAAPFFDAGTLVVTKADGEVITLGAANGSVIWRRSFAAPVAGSPSVAGERLYLALNDSRVLAVDPETGEPVWTYTVEGAPTGVLALDDQVVVGTRGNRIYSLKSENGRLRWTWQVGGDVMGPAIADEKNIYYAALDNVLRAVDRNSGNLRWTAPLPSRPLGGPVRTGDVVIVPTASADIGAYLIETGKPSFTIKAAGEQSGSVPFLREGTRPTATRLIVVSRDGILQGFAPRHEPPLAPFDTLPGATQVGSD